jgi:D-xylose reductase
MEHLMLANDARMPSVGLGLWKLDPKNAPGLVHQAIQIGYRHLDSACDYGNEVQVGQGIRSALDDGLCRRDALWVTSKLWNTYHHPQHVRPALERTLRDLQLDYLDLYLVHFPISLRYVPFEHRYPPGWLYDPSLEHPRMEPEDVRISETWGAMESLVDAGLVRHIGISNFGVSLIRDLLTYARIRPSVLQVESHPYLVQAKLRRYCQTERIVMTSFSPLGAGSYVPLGMASADDSALLHPVIQHIARETGRTAAQVVLRWGVQRPTAVIPKSNSVARLRENIGIFDFSLASHQMAAIDALDRHHRFNDPGVFCEQAFGCFYPIYE